MKKWIVILLGLSLLLSGCARAKKQNTNQPAEEIPAAAPVEEHIEEVAEEAHADPAPDLTAMSFVEKNTLYMQLFDEKLAAGADTALAESAYQKSIEASLSGDSAQADQALEEAILYLWNL